MQLVHILQPITLHQHALLLAPTSKHHLIREESKNKRSTEKWRWNFVHKSATEYDIESYRLLSPNHDYGDLVDPKH